MRAVLSLAISVSFCQLWAQAVVGSGAVSGRVFEKGSEGLPDAKVIVEKEDAGISRQVETNMDGVFQLPDLVPGDRYHLRITRTGFHDWISQQFEVSTGQNLDFQVTLERANSAAAGESSPPQPLVNAAIAPISRALSPADVETLPLEGRRWTQLALLGPAVSERYGSATPVMLGVFGAGMNILDGMLADTSYSRQLTPAVRIAPDTLQGAQVLSTGAPVEFGGALTGYVNTVTRGADKDWHGDFYAYYANAGLDALNRYSLGKQLFHNRYQTGLNAGGALTDKWFLFANVDYERGKGAALNRITNPLIVYPNVSGMNLSNCKATTAQCGVAARFINNQINAVVPVSEKVVSGYAKLDYRPNEFNLVNLSGYATSAALPQAGGLSIVSTNGGVLGGGVSRQYSYRGRLSWTISGATWSNDLRFGAAQTDLRNDPSKSGLSTGAAAIVLDGTTVGESFPNRFVLGERRADLIDNFRLNLGVHTILAGFTATRSRDWLESLHNSQGSYTYTSLTDFATDLSGSSGKTYAAYMQNLGLWARDLQSWNMGVYGQDTWRISPRFTLTAGLRWAKDVLPQPTKVNSSYYDTGTLHAPGMQAEPRIGLSYRLGDRWVARAGFGLYYQSRTAESTDAFFLGNGAYQYNLLVYPSQTGSPKFPAAISSTTTVIPTGSRNLLYSASKLGDPYSEQGSLSLERYLGAGVTMTASYVESRALRLWTAEDVNVGGNYTLTYIIKDATGQKTSSYVTTMWTSRNNTTYAHVYKIGNGGSAAYRAGVLQATKRFSRGFSARGAYTWSHAIDDVGGPQLYNAFAIGSNNTLYAADRGSSATDQRHRATIDINWQPTLLKNVVIARNILNGWEFSSITTLASAMRATPTVLVNGAQYSGAASFASSINGIGGWSRVPFWPVSSLPIEQQFTINARISRALKFTERVTGELMFETFNLTNSQFDTGVNTLAYYANGGVLTPVSDLGAGNAAKGGSYGSNSRSCQLAVRFTF
ncbi:MAG: TonB-dependent receptor [Acidobacteria bacterium]|nr:TonB-dependent receptor [Acidobacteriota bacterium]